MTHASENITLPQISYAGGKNVHCKQEFFVTKLVNIAINDFDVKTSHNSPVLVVSGTQCSGSFVYCKRVSVIREHFSSIDC